MKSESVETEFETVVEGDRTAADYADAVPVSTDESSMTANELRAYKRDEEREELISTLNRGAREINRNMNEFEGWADRIMRSVLAPAGKDAMLWWNPQPTKNGAGAPYNREL